MKSSKPLNKNLSKFERVSKTTYSTGKLKYYIILYYIIRAYLPDVVPVVTALILIHGLKFFELVNTNVQITAKHFVASCC